MRREPKTGRWGAVVWIGSALVMSLAFGAPIAAQQTAIEMTLERMVDLSLSNSFRIQNLTSASSALATA